MFPLSIVVILGLYYSFTISPGLTWAHFSADGGDLIAAAATGGVPHPAGYPLYLLLARIFQLIPLGPLAFRTNLFSAFCTVLASLVLYALLARAFQARPQGRWTAFFGALVYGTTPLIWGQAIVTEVYALHGLLFLICIYLLCSEHPPYPPWTCGLVTGLSASNHLTSLLLLPLLALGAEDRKIVSPSMLLQACLGVLAGLSLYLILPLRALSHPPVNWGNPSTFDGFIWLVSGQAYQTYTFSLSFVDILQRLHAASSFFVEQFTVIGIILVIYGLLSRIPGRLRLATVWASLSFFFFAITYAPLDSQVYLLPVWSCCVIWLAFGIQDLLMYFSTRLRHQTGLKVLLFISLVVRAGYVFPGVDLSQDTRAEDFVAEAFSHIPRDAIVIASGDEMVFSLWYLRFALMQRTDMIVVADGLLQFEWYRNNLRYTYPKLTIPNKNGLTPPDLILANPDRIVCFVSRDKPLVPEQCHFD
jgi:hypothetical protein